MMRLIEDAPLRVFVAGAGVRGGGYPNAWNTVRVLRSMPGVDVVDLCNWLPDSFRLWTIGRTGRLNALVVLLRLLLANAISAIRLLARVRGSDRVYVPYPSIFLLWLLSWLPGRWRPRCICDAYITVWDAFYQDRGMGEARGWLAAGLLRIESRALRAAESVLVDTTANAAHVARLFGVSTTRIVALPLALDPGTEVVAVAAPPPGMVRVLFMGTLVPLQGVEIIARAIDLLRGHEDLEFVLIGDGQQAETAAPWLRGHPRLDWIRDWQPPERLAGHLASADICLGVFGGQGKATRVLPFKVYLALRAGKPIVTQSEYSTPRTPPLPVESTPATAEALAAAIVALAGNPQRRVVLGEEARRYHAEHLGDAAIAATWQSLLLDSR